MTQQLELFNAEYRLRERVSTKARNIRIEVHPEREVVLVYPRWVPRADALAFLQSRTEWVRAKLDAFAERAVADPLPPLPRWDGTDEILLRGTLVPVMVEPARLRHLAVRIEAERITLFVPSQCQDQPQRLALALKRELMHRAQLDARRLLNEEAQRLGVYWRDLGIADPHTQWGSCGPDGTISLSWRLVMAPPAVFRYVVVHELCHRVHMDHSERFWALVEQQLPDFDQHRRWLRDHGHHLHHYLPKRRARGA
ncbi:M48 family metallopeptidase [Sinimarinibacterium sp. CAU 1509]|uniref:M48 family metallopeptidase n=1 Tax=Sinimarinibacterium sp. CAU 1509 TaxID=2562283 RepID=UPI0010AD6529|nr:SprT family zinc-dependent metalloprotease [Sinimarinibacterium sp. CAU 1509]TJY64737.1 M48 family metallopeptidase [Sinimarinibacterium sp. CAU 1509]